MKGFILTEENIGQTFSWYCMDYDVSPLKIIDKTISGKFALEDVKTDEIFLCDKYGVMDDENWIEPANYRIDLWEWMAEGGDRCIKYIDDCIFLMNDVEKIAKITKERLQEKTPYFIADEGLEDDSE